LHGDQWGRAGAHACAHEHAALLGAQHELQPGGALERQAVGALGAERKRDDPVVFVFHGQDRDTLGWWHGGRCWMHGRPGWGLRSAQPASRAAVSMPCN